MPQVGCATGSVLVDNTKKYSGSVGASVSFTPDIETVSNTAASSSTTSTQLSSPTTTDPNDAPKTPIVNITPVESTTPTVVTLPVSDLTGLDNEVLVRCSVGLYKTSTNPVTGGTIFVDFGYIPKGGTNSDFRPYSSQSIVVPSDFNSIGYNNAFYNSEFGTAITPTFNFVTNKVVRLEFIHQMYDYLAYANTDTTYFNNLIERFAIRINPINTNSLKVGVAAAIVLF
jgi:hypothetical protein